MTDNNTYTVSFNGEEPGSERGTVGVNSSVSFECDKGQYMSVLDGAVNNGLSLTASDGVFKNENGGRHYFLSVYIC